MAGGVVTVSEHELSEIRGLIETRSGILFDDSRERFFSTRDLEPVAPRQREQYFSRLSEHYLVRPRIRNLVTFAPMNLAQVVYMGKFDCIFCMNVLIYFSEERQAQLIQRFYEYLEPGGYLFLGHAESINRADVKFETQIHRDARIYQKPAALARPAMMQEKA